MSLRVPVLAIAATLALGAGVFGDAGVGATGGPANQAALLALSPRQVVQTYCVACHNDRIKTAGLSLENLDPAQVEGRAAIWEKVAHKLRTRTMPPQGRPRPDDAVYDALATTLETALDREAAAHPNPGRPAIHRLNRTEYGNAVRDLLTIDIEAVDGRALLPPDDTGYGFDNIADVLSVSPMLMDRYFSSARKIARLAIGDAAMRPGSRTYPLPKYTRQDDRMSDDLPFASRAGASIRHHFPVDGEYVVKINLLRTYTDLIRGLADPHQLEVRIDGRLIQQFTVGGDRNADGSRKSREQLNEELRMGDARLEAPFPIKAGPHAIGVSFQRQTSMPEGLLRPQFGVATYDYAGDTDVLPSVSSIVVRGPYNPRPPDDTPSRRAIFVCRPSSTTARAAVRAGGGPQAVPAERGARSARVTGDERCAEEILLSLGGRAYRRPLGADDVQGLMTFYREGARDGFEQGIQLALQKILVSPEFLFRVERQPPNATPGAPFRISDVDLASRLSFSLWSSIPDGELLDLAARGELGNAAVRQQQVRRMLADPRSRALVTNFAGQWLQAKNLRLSMPDPIQHPDFDENLRDAFQRETELFLDSQLREDRSVLELLTADYTYVNERLARHYGIPNVYGNQFRRVKLTDENRRGLLGQGTILTVTSYANRTAPTIRGKWVLENILGAPPPPPPPDVPSLEDEARGARPRSMRERMERHRQNPACSSCHAQMDPLGFALENFDAVGRWRESIDGTTRIDASGSLPDGTAFTGPGGLRRALVGHGDAFVRVLAEKLLTYALGRGVEYDDQPAVRGIIRGAAANDYRWSSLILQIVESAPFQMRMAAGDSQP